TDGRSGESDAAPAAPSSSRRLRNVIRHTMPGSQPRFSDGETNRQVVRLRAVADRDRRVGAAGRVSIPGQPARDPHASRRGDPRSLVAGAPASGPFVRAAGVDLFIQELGPKDAPVVLFVHGMGAWSELWRDTLVATAAAGSHAVALDLPPFGYSERPAPPAY